MPTEKSAYVNIFEQIQDPGPQPEDPGPMPSPTSGEGAHWLRKYLSSKRWLEANRRFQLAQAAKELEKIEDPSAIVRAVSCLAVMVLTHEIEPRNSIGALFGPL
jgi:hypothetical protein